MDIKKTLYSLGIFKPEDPTQRIIRRFAIIFVLGGLITIIKNLLAGTPLLDDIDKMFWTSLLAMLEKALREHKEIK